MEKAANAKEEFQNSLTDQHVKYVYPTTELTVKERREILCQYQLMRGRKRR